MSTLESLAERLLGTTICGWKLHAELGRGKSAVVYSAEKNGRAGAVKVFDPHLIRRHGPEAQAARQARERTLIDRVHPNVIQIFEAAHDEENDFFLVVMELFSGSNLGDCLQQVPNTQVLPLFRQIVLGAKFLEEQGFAHRDIKPENIGISPDFTCAKLLDLGVIRPLEGYFNVTDHGDQLVFVGTLQYSPPELLFRTEGSSAEAWRAITFYQLGAVLHDLLKRKALFSWTSSPYAQLVRAVEREPVAICSTDYPLELSSLVNDCLSKTPERRLELVSWTRLLDPIPDKSPFAAAQDRIRARRTSASPRSIRFAPTAPLLAREIHIDAIERLIAASQRNGLPRFECTQLLTTDNAQTTYTGKLTYEPSQQAQLYTGVIVYLETRAIGAGDVRIRVAVLLAGDVPSQEQDLATAPLKTVFEGTYESRIVEEKLEEILVLAVDRAQNLRDLNALSRECMWLTEEELA